MQALDRLNRKLKNRERVYGYTAYLPDTYALGEYMPEGVDYILFDCEHGPHDVDYYAPYFRVCRERGIPTIVRVADAAYHLVARATDLGADGVLIPRVETLEQVRVALEGLRLPPIGKKGYGGKFQFYPGEDIKHYNHSRLLWIQIESPAGADLLPEILDRWEHEISGVVIGPCDLSINCGTPLDFWSDAESAVIERVYAICKAHGVSAGIYTMNPEDLEKRVKQGANIIWDTCDAVMLARAIANEANFAMSL